MFEDVQGKDMVLLKEVAALLARHGALRCMPTVEVDDESASITLTVSRYTAMQIAGPHGLGILDLLHDAQYLSGLCQVRAFAQLYNIDPTALEALLPKQDCESEDDDDDR